jgi:PAS domain-containing protein
VIGSLAHHGVRVLPVLTASPKWAARTPETPPLQTPRGREGWRAFAAAAVDRYGPGGEYWATRYHRQFPDGRMRPITTWQVWNEQNREQTFSPRPSPRRYAQLLRIAHEGIAARDPDAKVLLGGMPGFADRSAWGYLARLYRQPGVKRRFDAVALHPYAQHPRDVLVQIKRIRRVMRVRGDGHTPIWVTELGWGSNDPDWFGINAGIDGQKRMLKRTFPRLIDRRKRWNLEHVLWFEWRDPPSNAGQCGFCESAGLFWNDQRPKPSWRAFKRLTRPRD